MWISRQAARIMGNHNKVPSSETEFKESVLRLNFIRGSNIVGPTWNIIQYFEIWASDQLEPVFGG